MGGASLGSLRLCPHLLQNLKPAGGFEPQFGQTISISSDEPHAPQNIESSGFSNWHFGHFIDRSSMMKVWRKIDFKDSIKVIKPPNRRATFRQELGRHIFIGFPMMEPLSLLRG
jgi:hypothetical protein